jgi:hypothetical protein
MEWFSTVTTRRWRLACACTKASSKGLSVCALATATAMPCARKARAAARAGSTINPLAMTSASPPASTPSSAWMRPISSGSHGVPSGSAALARSIRRYTGPLWSAAARTAAGTCAGPEGSMTVMWGSARISATSSMAWWLTPRMVERPGRKPTIFTSVRGYATCIAIWSKGRRVANTQKVCTQACSPLRASPPASPTMLASAMPGFDEALGERVAEQVGLGRGREVGREADDVRAFAGELRAASRRSSAEWPPLPCSLRCAAAAAVCAPPCVKSSTSSVMLFLPVRAGPRRPRRPAASRCG